MTFDWNVIVPIVVAFLGGGAVVEFIRQKWQKPVTDAQSKNILNENWETLLKENARQMDNLRKSEEEAASLRPLVLKLAIQNEEMKQCHEDKEDWKRYAKKLATQLEENKLMPIPFRRYPGDDSDKIAAIMPDKPDVKP